MSTEPQFQQITLKQYLPSLLLFITIFQTCINAYSDKPNFIFIIADDLGFNDVGWRGSTNVYTPNLNNLHNNESIELTRFYVAPKCAPTRASLMTGRYTYKIGMQHAVGLLEIHTCGIKPSINNTFFTERLKTCSGYNNYYMGKWHLGEWKWSTTPIFRGGFDYYKGYLNSHIDYFNFSYEPGIYDWRENTDILLDTDDNYTTFALGDKALEIINNISATDDDTPFTMMVAFESPHSPIHWAPEPYTSEALTYGGPWGHPNDTYYTSRRQYTTMIYAMDYYIGEIVGALKENMVNGESMWDNTYLFFFSDNGGVITYASNYPLRGAKATNFEGGIRAPALISGGLLDASLRGTVYDGLVHITDFYATIMDLTNTSSSDLLLDGESLRNLMDPNINTHSRDRFIITADNVECNATYINSTYDGNGTANASIVCGGIIRDFGEAGIFKLVIGNAIDGTSNKHGWGQLANIKQIISQTSTPQQIVCDPKNIGLVKPSYNNQFKAYDCGPNLEPCLYKLDEDPCEYEDKSYDLNYTYYFDQLMTELIAAYNKQAPPFWDAPECYEYSGFDIIDYQQSIGYWSPAAYYFTKDAAVKKENTPIYTGVCAPTSSPTMEPTTEPTLEPTYQPTADPTVEPTVDAETGAPTMEPTVEPTMEDICVSVEYDWSIKVTLQVILAIDPDVGDNQVVIRNAMTAAFISSIKVFVEWDEEFCVNLSEDGFSVAVYDGDRRRLLLQAVGDTVYEIVADMEYTENLQQAVFANESIYADFSDVLEDEMGVSFVQNGVIDEGVNITSFVVAEPVKISNDNGGGVCSGKISNGVMIVVIILGAVDGLIFIICLVYILKSGVETKKVKSTGMESKSYVMLTIEILTGILQLVFTVYSLVNEVYFGALVFGVLLVSFILLYFQLKLYGAVIFDDGGIKEMKTYVAVMSILRVSIQDLPIFIVAIIVGEKCDNPVFVVAFAIIFVIAIIAKIVMAAWLGKVEGGNGVRQFRKSTATESPDKYVQLAQNEEEDEVGKYNM